jgi:hypothetical protein
MAYGSVGRVRPFALRGRLAEHDLHSHTHFVGTDHAEAGQMSTQRATAGFGPRRRDKCSRSRPWTRSFKSAERKQSLGIEVGEELLAHGWNQNLGETAEGNPLLSRHHSALFGGILNDRILERF